MLLIRHTTGVRVSDFRTVPRTRFRPNYANNVQELLSSKDPSRTLCGRLKPW